MDLLPPVRPKDELRQGAVSSVSPITPAVVSCPTQRPLCPPHANPLWFSRLRRLLAGDCEWNDSNSTHNSWELVLCSHSSSTRPHQVNKLQPKEYARLFTAGCHKEAYSDCRILHASQGQSLSTIQFSKHQTQPIAPALQPTLSSQA